MRHASRLSAPVRALGLGCMGMSWSDGPPKNPKRRSRPATKESGNWYMLLIKA